MTGLSLLLLLFSPSLPPLLSFPSSSSFSSPPPLFSLSSSFFPFFSLLPFLLAVQEFFSHDLQPFNGDEPLAGLRQLQVEIALGALGGAWKEKGVKAELEEGLDCTSIPSPPPPPYNILHCDNSTER